ncbi:MAG: ATP-dependent sacrificial sulfur transferase LarE [Thermodesulfovibrionales bacterium]
MAPETDTDGKLRNLMEILRGMESAVLALSGGVDSVFLLKAMALSGIRALAVTAVSETTPAPDLEDARRAARALGVPHREIRTREMEDENFASNPPDRCFYCKDELFGRLSRMAREEGYAFVLDGGNMDDASDHRPGRRAALKHGVRSPLEEAGFTKADIREASRALGLGTWDKPASPCLSSRFPYGTRITGEALRRVARAEEALRGLGFRDLRVRDHGGGAARVEVPGEDMERLFLKREAVVSALRALGYRFVCLDLEGLESGRMNRAIGAAEPVEAAGDAEAP